MLINEHRSNRAASGTGIADTEALQTDVMRFIAIIGLCLTAIFSLMRSIADPAQSSLEKAKIKDLQQQLTRLQGKIVQQDRSTRQLREKLSSNQDQLAHAKLQQQKLRIQIYELRQQESSAQTKAIESDHSASPPKPRDQGFVLKFASEKTLSQLIHSGQVNLLGIVDQQAWQLSIQEQHPSFHKISMPDKYYEMLPGTLPTHYRRSFYASVKQTKATDTLWAVQIPPSTEKQVQRLLQTASGGQLIIQADAGVSLE